MKNKKRVTKNEKNSKLDEVLKKHEWNIMVGVFLALPLTVVIVIQTFYQEMTWQEGIMFYISLIPAFVMIFALLYSVNHNRKIFQDSQDARKEDNNAIKEILQQMQVDRERHREDMKMLIETLSRNAQISEENAQKRHEETMLVLTEALKELRRGNRRRRR